MEALLDRGLDPKETTSVESQLTELLADCFDLHGSFLLYRKGTLRCTGFHVLPLLLQYAC